MNFSRELKNPNVLFRSSPGINLLQFLSGPRRFYWRKNILQNRSDIIPGNSLGNLKTPMFAFFQELQSWGSQDNEILYWNQPFQYNYGLFKNR